MVHAILPAKTGVDGKRPVGRPRGTILDTTKLVHKERAEIIRLGTLRAKKFLDAQSIVALGTHHMVTKTIDEEGRTHFNIVRDHNRQQKLLDTGVYGQDYLIIEGTPADWRAADAILNRIFGKPKETIELEGDVTFNLKALHVHAVALGKETAIAAPAVVDSQ